MGVNLTEEYLSKSEVDPSTGLSGSTAGLTEKAFEQFLQSGKGTVTPINPVSAASVGGGVFLNRADQYDGVPVRFGADNEELRAQGQSAVGMIAKGAGRLIGSTATKLLEGAGYVVSSVPALLTGDFSVMADNGFSAMMSDAEETFKDEVLPIYKTNRYKEGNILEQMGTLGFWTDDAVDGVAFLASAYLQGSGIGALAGKLGTGAKMASGLSKFTRAAKVGDVASGAFNTAKWANRLDLATISAVNSISEAAMEAKDTKSALMNSFKEDIQLGLMSEQEANIKASEAAKKTFLYNMTVLQASNYLEASMMFKNMSHLGTKELVDGAKLGKNLTEAAAKGSVESLSKKQLAGIFAKDALLSSLSEGVYEENIQTAIQNYNVRKAEGKENRGVARGILENMVDNFSTDEGQKSIVLGSLIGLIPGGAAGVKEAKRERLRETAVNAARGEMLANISGSNVKDYYVKEKDEAGNEKVKVNSKGEPELDGTKLASTFKQAYDKQTNFVEGLRASANGDKVMFDYFKTKAFANYILPMINSGASETDIHDAIEFQAKLEEEESAKAGVPTDGAYLLGQKQEYKKMATKLKDLYETFSENYVDPKNFGEGRTAELARRSTLKQQYDNSVEQIYWTQKAKELKAAGETEKAKQVSAVIKDNQAKMVNLLNPAKQAEVSKEFNRMFSEDIQNNRHANTNITSNVKDETPTVVREDDTVEEAETLTPETAEKLGYTADLEKSNIRNQEVTGGDTASVFYKTFPGNRVHTVVTDGTKTGNIIKSTDTVTKQLVDKEGNKSRVVLNYTNDKAESATLIDDITGEEKYLTLPKGEFTTANIDSLVDKITDLESFDYKDKGARFVTAAEAKTGIMSGEDTVALSEVSNEVKDATASTPKRPVDIDYADVNASKTLNSAVMHRAEYKGKEGVLYKSKGNIIFKSDSGDTISIALKNKSKRTFSELGINILTPSVHDIEVGGDFGTVTINGRMYAIPETFLPMDAIQENRDGSLNSITLETLGGKRVVFTDPTIVQELANNIVLGEYVKDIVYNKLVKQSPLIIGDKYAVYRKNGNYIVHQTGFQGQIPAGGATYDKVVNKANKALLSKVDLFSRDSDSGKVDYSIPLSIPKDELFKNDEGVRFPTDREALKLPTFRELQDVKRIAKRAKQENLGTEDEVAINKAAHLKYSVHKKALEISRKTRKSVTTEDVELVQPTEEGESEDKAYEIIVAEHGIIHPSSSAAYTYFDRVDSKHKTNAVDFMQHIINEDLTDAEVTPEIDWDYKEFWDKNPKAEEALMNNKIPAGKAEEGSFGLFVDTIPIKLVYKDGKDTFDTGVYMHKSGYQYIKVPAEIKAQGDEAIAAYILDRQFETREVRSKILAQILDKGTANAIPVSKKTMGFPNTQPGAKNNIGDVLIKADPDIDLRTITLGVGTSTEAGDGHSIISTGSGKMAKGFGKPGNVYLTTKFTANKEEGTFKLNPSKLSVEHAAMVLNCFAQAYTRGSGGMRGVFQGEGVTGGLTVGEVLDILVLQGKKYTEVTDNDKPHLLSKQLWAKDGILHFGEDTLDLRKINEENVTRFLDWATTNKNYVVQERYLEKVFKDKPFTLGSLSFDPATDNYNSMVIKNNLVTTDLDVVEGTKSVTTRPVMVFEPAFAGYTYSEAQKADIQPGTDIKLVSPEEVKPSVDTEDKPTKPGRGLRGLHNKNPYRVVNTDYKGTSKYDISTELEWLNNAFAGNRFGAELKVKMIDGLINIAGDRRAFGQFTADAILLSNMAAEGTVYHEAFHRVSLGYLSEAERDLIRKEVVSKHGSTEESAEEDLAEMFRKYMLSQTKPIKLTISQKISKIFRDIVDFITTWFTGDYKLGSVDIDTLFKAVKDGKYRFAKISKERYAAIKGDSHNFEVNGAQLKQVSSDAEFREVVKSLFYTLVESSGLIKGDTISLSSLDDVKKLNMSEFRGAIEQEVADYKELVSNYESSIAVAANNPTKEQLDEIKELDLGMPELPNSKVIQELENQLATCARLSDLYTDVLNNYSTYADALFDYMDTLKVRSIKGTVNEDEEIGSEDGDAIANELLQYDRTTFESNSKDNVAANIKVMLSVLRDSDERSSLTGLFTFTEFGPLWNRLHRDLKGTTTVEDMLKVLKSKESYVPYTVLLKHLAKDEEIRTQFWVTFNKTHAELLNLFYGEDGEGNNTFTMGNSSVLDTTGRNLKEWNSSFTRGRLFYNDRGAVTPDKEGFNGIHELYNRLLIDVKTSVDSTGTVADIEATSTRVASLLQAVGIGYTTDDVISLLGVDTQVKDMLNLVANKLSNVFGKKGTLYKLFNGTKVTTNRGGKEINVNFDTAFSNESAIRELATKHAEMHNSEQNLTVVGAAGAKYYTVNQHTFMTNTLANMKKGAAVLDDMVSATYNKNSYYLKSFRDNPELLKDFKLPFVGAVIKEDSGDTGRTYQGVTILEDYYNRILANETGYITPPTPADRNAYFFYKGAPAVDAYLSSNMSLDNKVIEIFRGYLSDEVDRIVLTKAQVDLAVETENSRDLVEFLHYKVISKSDIQDGDITLSVPGNKTEVKLLKRGGKYVGRGTEFSNFAGFTESSTDRDIDVSLMRAVDVELEYATSLGIINKNWEGKYTNAILPRGVLNKVAVKVYGDQSAIYDQDVTIRSLFANYTINSIVASIETGKMFTGDPASYKSEDDQIKRINGFTSTGDNLRTDFPQGYFNGDSLVTGDTYNTCTFSSRVIVSDLYDELVDKHAEYYVKEGIAYDLDYAKKIAKEKLKALRKVDQTDAQTFITPAMFRAISIRLGEWGGINGENEKAYQALINPNTEEKEARESYDILMHTLKLTYMRVNNINGQSVPVFDKMSMAPLFRHIVKGTQLEEVLDRMEGVGKYKGMKPIEQLKFHTANKIGIQDRRQLFDDSQGLKLTDLKKIETYQQYFGNLRKQLVTDPHDTESIALGSQVKKLAILNTDLEADYSYNGEKLTGRDVVREIHETASALSDLGVAQFRDDFKLNEDYQIVDKEGFMEKLRQEAKTANMPDYIIDSLKTDSEGNFFIELDAHPGTRKWIQTRQISLLKKAAIDLHLPGNSFIQASNVGLEKVVFEDGKPVADASSRLKMFNANGNIECKVSTSLFRTLIPNYSKLSHAERVEYLKDRPELTALGYRIPTQGQNSIYVLEVKEFLEDTIGDTIILPAEGTSIGGFDFDIDKLYVVRHNYDKKGNKVKYLNESNSTFEERFDRFAREEGVADQIRKTTKAYRPNIDNKDARAEMHEDIEAAVLAWKSEHLEEFKTRSIVKQNVKVAIENRMLDMYFAVLKNNNHFAQRTQPLGYGAGKLKNLAENILDWVGYAKRERYAFDTNVPRYQMEVKAKFGFGGEGLGPAALANAHHALGQYVKLGLFTNLGVGKVDEDTNSTSLWHKYGVDNEMISEWLSALVDAHVDIAADPYIYNLNATGFTRDVLTLLIRSGVGGVNTFSFIAQPILKEISVAVANAKNKIGKQLSTTAVIQEIETEYIKSMGEAATEEFKIVDFSPENMSDIFDILQLTADFKESANPIRSAEWWNRQLNVLRAFQFLESPADALTQATLSSRVDAKGFGINASQILLYDSKVQEALEATNNETGIRNFDKLMSDTFLNSMTKNSVDASIKMLSNLVLEATPAFKEAVKQVISGMGAGAFANAELVKNISDELYVNIAAEHFVNNNYISPEKLSKLIYGDSAIANTVSDVKNGVKWKHLMHNALIKSMYPTREQDMPSFIAFTKPDDRWDKNSLERAWREILTDENDAIVEFGKDLFIYSYITSGFKATSNSFFEVAPRSLIKDLGYNEHIRSMFDVYKDPAAMLTGIDELYKNAWNNESIVPTIARKRISNHMVSNGEVYMFQLRGADVVGTNSKKQLLFQPYVKIKNNDGTSNLYKYIGYDSKTRTPFYIVQEKKSYYNKGFVVRENMLERTSFSKNKSKITPGTYSYIMGSEGTEFDRLTKMFALEKNGTRIFSKYENITLVTDKAVNKYGSLLYQEVDNLIKKC